MNSLVKLDWRRSCWQMRAFCCGFQRNRWWLYICVCIFYSLSSTFVFSFPMSCISGIWQCLILSVPNMRCADTFTHEWNNLQDYCYCTWWFLCRFLPVWTNLTSISSVFHCNSVLNHKWVPWNIYLLLFVKVAPLICKWLIVEFDNVGGSLKGRCLYSFNLSVTKYWLWQHKQVLEVFKTFSLENPSALPQSNIWGF